MKKAMQRIVSLIVTAMLAIIPIAPAFAAELNANEQTLYNEFSSAVESYRSILGDATANQYLAEAKSGLLAVDLDSTACAEFSQAIKDTVALFKNNNCKTRRELWAVLPQALQIVNSIANKYGLSVSVGARGVASVSVTTGGSGANAGKTTTVATTSNAVKQTGFGLGQTAAVVAIAAAVLAGGFMVARKDRLFA